MLRAMDTPACCRPPAAAAFFDLDKTIISRSSTLVFVPSFYRHGLINRLQAARGAIAQFVFRRGGAGRDGRGWPVLDSRRAIEESIRGQRAEPDARACEQQLQ
jgi:hypothetical protein